RVGQHPAGAWSPDHEGYECLVGGERVLKLGHFRDGMCNWVGTGTPGEHRFKKYPCAELLGDTPRLLQMHRVGRTAIEKIRDIELIVERPARIALHPDLVVRLVTPPALEYVDSPVPPTETFRR